MAIGFQTKTKSEPPMDEQSATPKKIFKPKPYDSLLGTMSDQDLAEATGVSNRTIRDRRKLLGVDAWSVEVALDPHKHLLGILSDKEIANISGVGISSVTKYRKERDIHPHPLAEFVPLLGLVSDEDVARVSEMPLTLVETVRWILNIEELVEEIIEPIQIVDFEGPLLGFESLLTTATVTEIQRQTGIHFSIIERRRDFLGLPVFQNKSKLDRYKHLVGIVPVPLLAKLVGLSGSRVRQLRKLAQD